MTKKKSGETAAPAEPSNRSQNDATDPQSEAPQASQEETGQAEVEQSRAERIEMLKKIEELKKARLKKQIDSLEADVKEPNPKVTTASDVELGDADAPPGEPKPSSMPPARKATLHGRHIFALTSFVMFVILPTFLVGWYMYERATDRYVSYMGFSVRTEETGSAFELLGGVAELSGSSSSDTDILYRFIESQQLVAAVHERINLEELWTHPSMERDPIFSYDGDGTIEDLRAYWKTMVDVYADSSTGLIDLQVQAYAPEDAQMVAQVIFDESLIMINRLSAIARDDATGYAREELDQTVERLKEARTAMTQFRNRTQIIDPSASISSQLGILASLQSELAQTLIDLDLLRQTTNANDPRAVQAQQRVDVIEARIEDERTKFGQGSGETGTGSEAFADLIGEYETLAVDLEFAETSYQAAQAALDAAINEARRQSRYLAAHIQPTLPQSPEKPERFNTTLLFGFFAALAWAILLLAAYALRDRR